MLHWMRRKAELRRTADALYACLVQQARNEHFYGELAVPDTMEGRFEMIVLHLVLVLERLRDEADDGQRLGQVVMERLIADMDDALRQIGIGDMGVPRRVQKAAAALAERSRDYRNGLAAGGDSMTGDGALAIAVQRHIHAARPVADGGVTPQASALAAYARESARRLSTLATEEILAGRAAFASPQDFASLRGNSTSMEQH